MTSKPSFCPFCKGQSRVAQSDTVYWVRCNECGAEGPTDPDERKAVAAWDRRATQPTAGEPVAIANRGKAAFWVRWTDAAEGLYGPGIKLYAAPPAAAHGDEAVTNLVPGLQWAIDYCNAMQRQGNERMLVEVIRKRLENVRDNQPAAMRAQGDGGQA